MGERKWQLTHSDGLAIHSVTTPDSSCWPHIPQIDPDCDQRSSSMMLSRQSVTGFASEPGTSPLSGLPRPAIRHRSPIGTVAMLATLATCAARGFPVFRAPVRYSEPEGLSLCRSPHGRRPPQTAVLGLRSRGQGSPSDLLGGLGRPDREVRQAKPAIFGVIEADLSRAVLSQKIAQAWTAYVKELRAAAKLETSTEVTNAPAPR